MRYPVALAVSWQSRQAAESAVMCKTSAVVDGAIDIPVAVKGCRERFIYSVRSNMAYEQSLPYGVPIGVSGEAVELAISGAISRLGRRIDMLADRRLWVTGDSL